MFFQKGNFKKMLGTSKILKHSLFSFLFYFNYDFDFNLFCIFNEILRTYLREVFIKKSTFKIIAVEIKHN